MSERDSSMAAQYRSGAVLKDIATPYGLTRERVRQIVRKAGLTAQDGGICVRVQKSTAIETALKDHSSRIRRGCSFADYKKLRGAGVTYHFTVFRKNCDVHNIELQLNLWQWWQIWEASGHWDERGRGRGYQMRRINKHGPYSLDNTVIERGNSKWRSVSA